MRTFKCFLNFDKEEKWLHEMAMKGYELFSVGFGYDFREGAPENSIIRIDYRTFSRKSDYIDYCTLFEDSGWKHVAGSRNTGAQYFKKVGESATEDIFSDEGSKAGRYKRLADMWLVLGVVYLPLFVSFVTNGSIHIEAFSNPKMLYYTPQLWEMTGSAFWSHFLFETPFALMRGFAWLVFPVLIIVYFVFAIKAMRLYKKSQRGQGIAG